MTSTDDTAADTAITRDMIDAYRTAKAATNSSAEATKALMARGLDFDSACDAAWLIETGKAEPTWQHEDGTPTAACHEFYAGCDHSEDQ